MRCTIALSLLLASCGEPNQLWGSIRESHPMDFDRVAIARQGHALSIEYLRDRGPEPEWVCKLTLDTEGLELADHSGVKAESFTGRVVVERNTDTEDRLPRVTGGILYFEEYGVMGGAAVCGDFNVLFDNGRNLAGAFVSTLVVRSASGLEVPPSHTTPLSVPAENSPIGDYTVDGTSCAACSPVGFWGVLSAVWLVRRRERRK